MDDRTAAIPEQVRGFLLGLKAFSKVMNLGEGVAGGYLVNFDSTDPISRSLTAMTCSVEQILGDELDAYGQTIESLTMVLAYHTASGFEAVNTLLQQARESNRMPYQTHRVQQMFNGLREDILPFLINFCNTMIANERNLYGHINGPLVKFVSYLDEPTKIEGDNTVSTLTEEEYSINDIVAILQCLAISSEKNRSVG